MRVEITDDNAYTHVIDSQNLKLIGEWFADKAKLLMSANSQFGDCRMRIWPSTYDESKLIPEYHRQVQLTQDELLDFAKGILEASAVAGAQEEANRK